MSKNQIFLSSSSSPSSFTVSSFSPFDTINVVCLCLSWNQNISKTKKNAQQPKFLSHLFLHMHVGSLFRSIKKMKNVKNHFHNENQKQIYKLRLACWTTFSTKNTHWKSRIEMLKNETKKKKVFGNIALSPDTAITRHNNFRSFVQGLMLLFR